MTSDIGVASDIRVAVDALRVDARIWDEQAGHLVAARTRADSLRMNRLQLGIYQTFHAAYSGAVDLVTARCASGVTAVREVASTLRHVADVYEDEERRNLHALNNLY
jgi:hypothetical protein